MATSRRSLLLLLCFVGVISPVAGWQPVRHAGKVEHVDCDEGVVVVDELGWRGRPQRRVFHVGIDTPIVSVRRPRPWDTYENVALTLFDVIVGDFVVVETNEQEGRWLAQKITVIEPDRSRLGR